MLAEHAFDGAEADAVGAGEFGLGSASGGVGGGDGVALVLCEAVGGGLGPVGGSVNEAFDGGEADAVLGGEGLLGGAGVEGGDQFGLVGGGEACGECARGCWRVGDGRLIVGGAGGQRPGFGSAGGPRA